MFYSQFILAKKGPLGTIWIAAHLERKLRKNQVADTDIGVSVDSILFPDVPIALRLSSHLLLGVVRIYSRKVNYLFDDCSEALLKIKQAFRSTAVDLPPEESTAPYHSITLPETFDLDDFELPESDIFQGNYVDHHVSSREQITLQDTMEGVVYSTSQFGLDERFGDGDTSGLDLDEELFLNKVADVEHAGVMLSSDAGLQSSVRPVMPLKQDENHEVMTANSETMLATDDINEIEGFDGDTDFIEYAQAPCTPGLLEEPNLSNVQETSVFDDHLESENHNLEESAVKENLENASNKSDIHHGNQNVVGWTLLSDMNPDTVHLMPAEKNGYHLDGPESSQLKTQEQLLLTAVTIDQISSDNHLDSASLPSSSLADQVGAMSPVPELSDIIIAASNGPDRVEDLQNGTISNVSGFQIVDGIHEDCVEPPGVRLDGSTPDMSNSTQSVQLGVSEINQASPKTQVSNDVEIAGNLEKSYPPSIALESMAQSHDRPDHEKLESQVCEESKDNEQMECTHIHVLRPCITHLNQPNMSNPERENSVDPDLPCEVAGLCSQGTSGREEAPHASGASTAVQGEEGCHATDGSEQVLEENHITEPASFEVIHEKSSKSKDHVDNVSGDGQLETLNSSASSDLPAPEKLLSAPEGLADVPNNLLMEATPDKGVLLEGDGGGLVSQNVSGKKRRFTESAPTVQSLNSVESLAVVQTRGTVESIPNDDDLLSSILGGRKSSVLKVKPTPPGITSMKRPRSAPRTSASKRKVLMDDSMVLHGDTIRLQLTYTEDIRRIRKKAPCTRPEISMIQKQFWGEEIFNESILGDVSAELASLHNQTYDLSETSVSQNDASFGAAMEPKLISQNDPSETRVSQNDVNDASFEAAMDPKLISQNDENFTSLKALDDMDMSIGPNFSKETGIECSSNHPIAVRGNGEAQFFDIPVQIEKQQCEDHTVSSEIYATEVQMKLTSAIAEPKSSQHELFGVIAEMEIDGISITDADSINPVVTVGVESSYPTDPVSCGILAGMVQFDKPSEADASLEMDEPHPGMLLDQKLDMLSINGVDGSETAEKEDDKIAAVETEYRAKDDLLLGETEGGVAFEIGTEIQAACLEHTKIVNPSANFSPESVGYTTQVATVNQAMGDIQKNEQGVVNEEAIFDAEGQYNNAKKSVFSGTSGEGDSSYPADVNVDLGNVSLDDVENPGRQEVYSLSTMEAEISAIDQDDRNDFNYSAVGHDTEFLNFDDDDEVAEADGDCMPSAGEEIHYLENSGWSSRTRAVANYLQTLFDKEPEHGRKVLPIDNLLVGKTRKEASRMFFEALVLKTKDYIHVEQKTAFDNINILPRVKLMKSGF